MCSVSARLSFSEATKGLGSLGSTYHCSHSPAEAKMQERYIHETAVDEEELHKTEDVEMILMPMVFLPQHHNNLNTCATRKDDMKRIP